MATTFDTLTGSTYELVPSSADPLVVATLRRVPRALSPADDGDPSADMREDDEALPVRAVLAAPTVGERARFVIVLPRHEVVTVRTTSIVMAVRESGPPLSP